MVRKIPPDLPAAMLVTVHIPSWHRSELPALISRISGLPAVHPTSGQRIEKGHVYVAPADNHLIIEDSHVQLWHGPKENRYRPSINALFRSAAISYGERTVGVVLSGMLDDGATGLWWIKRFGGVAVVQDPDESPFPDMPSAALEHVAVDYVRRVAEMGALFNDLARGTSEREADPRVDLREEAS